jgi:hypothetical protein
MRTHDDHGFALPITIFALMIVGVLTMSSFYISRQETRISIASTNAGTALYLAEEGLSQVLDGWNMADAQSMAPWTTRTVTDTLSYGLWSVDITRMTGRLFLLESSGTVTRGGTILSGASRRVASSVRVFTAEISPDAAMTTRGPTSIKGGAQVRGEDDVPPGWDTFCPGPLTDKPGLLTDNASQVSLVGGADITGAPAIEEDPTISDETFRQFGELNWDELVAMADIHLPSGTINGTAPDSTLAGGCITSNPTNWGNPLNPNSACGDYFPIIHIDAPYGRIQSGGVGQGILLVDGDLDLRGGFIFHGIVIVQGNFETQGSGNRVLGGVMASNVDFDLQSLGGTSVVSYSSCAVERAVLNNANLNRARPLAQRSWVDLSAISPF